MIKYVGKKHDHSAVKPSYVLPAMKNIPDQKKGSKDKKKNNINSIKNIIFIKNVFLYKFIEGMLCCFLNVKLIS